MQNEALLTKFLHKFYNHHDIPWVGLIWDSYYHESVPHTTSLCGSFWCKDVFKLFSKYCQFAKPSLGNGRSIMFWNDTWILELNGSSISQSFPRLFSYVLDGQLSVAQVLGHDLLENFHLPLSTQAFQELQSLQQILVNYQISAMNDQWIWLFNKGCYRPKSYYIQVHSVVVDPLFPLIWKTSCTLRDRLNTRDMLQRRHWHVDDHTCVLCPHLIHEDVWHLFFSCNFSQNVWNYLQIS